jgi:hypothetical protein
MSMSVQMRSMKTTLRRAVPSTSSRVQLQIQTRAWFGRSRSNAPVPTPPQSVTNQLQLVQIAVAVVGLFAAIDMRIGVKIDALKSSVEEYHNEITQVRNSLDGRIREVEYVKGEVSLLEQQTGACR